MIENIKGMREKIGAEARTLSFIHSVWHRVSHLYGYQIYFPPFLEPLALYKKGVNDELYESQMYVFEDKSKEKKMVAIRPEMTPTVGRMVADLKDNKQFKKPLRWYSVPELLRYENTQKGRTRQFAQWNVDLFGISDIWADAEIISIADTCMKQLGFEPKEYEIRVNDKHALEQSLRTLLGSAFSPSLYDLLDKRAKIDSSVFETTLKKEYGIDVATYEKATRTPPTTIHDIQEILGDVSLVYSPETVRGFNYYTNVVFEVFFNDDTHTRSILGGGRYDTLIHDKQKEFIPAVGFGMGDEVLFNILSDRTNGLDNATACLVVYGERGCEKDAQMVAHMLRKERGVSAAYFPSPTPSDVYKYAEKEHIPFVVVVSNNGTTYRDISTQKDISEEVFYTNVHTL